LTATLSKFLFFLFFYLAALTASSTREREREKESEKESFETCLVSLFSQLLCSFFAVGFPSILALLVGSQAPSNKLPPTSSLQQLQH
jgi:uncharacterized membrane protein YfcA